MTMPERIRAIKTTVLRTNQLVILGFRAKVAFDMVVILTLKFHVLLMVTSFNEGESIAQIHISHPKSSAEKYGFSSGKN